MSEPLRLPAAMWQEMLALARRERPKECCGIVGGKDGRPMRFLEAHNADPNPIIRYSIAPKELLRIHKELDAAGEDLLAIFHSHPASPAYPSQTDVRLAFYPEATYLIVSLADLDQPVLRGFWIREGKITERPVAVED